MADFEKIVLDADVKIGCFLGSEKILFIKTGQGGTIYGYDNKYLSLAIRIREEYGFSVFVSETTVDNEETYKREMEIVNDIFENKSLQIYYLGVSKGGLIGCWYGAKNPYVKRIMMVNAPLMLNFHSKTLPAIKSFGCEKILAVYGTLDPSYNYTPFIKNHTILRVIEGANHNLVGSDVSLYDLVRDLIKE